MKFKTAYITVEKAVEAMLEDETLYPGDEELADLSEVKDEFNNTYKDDSKFREIFKVKANAVREVTESKTTSNSSKSKLTCEICTGSNSSETSQSCFRTTGGIVFGIPDTDFNEHTIDPHTDAYKYVPITVYTKYSNTATLKDDAFIVGVSYNGKIRLLTTVICNKNSKEMQCQAEKYLQSQSHRKE